MHSCSHSNDVSTEGKKGEEMQSFRSAKSFKWQQKVHKIHKFLKLVMLPWSICVHVIRIHLCGFLQKQQNEEWEQWAAGCSSSDSLRHSSVVKASGPRWVLLQFTGWQCLQILQSAICSHGELGVSCGEQVKDTRLKVHILHLQSLSTLGSGSLHCVDLVRRPQRAQLCVGALKVWLLALMAQGVLFDELVAWAAVQAQL